MKPRRVIFINVDTDFRNWTFRSSPPEDNTPITWIELQLYIEVYMNSGKGGKFKKALSLLKRAITFSLKPSQVSSEKP